MASFVRAKSASHESPSSYSPVSFASSTASAFAAPRSSCPKFLARDACVAQFSPSVRFSTVDRSMSPSRSISIRRQHSSSSSSNQKRTCMCAPTTHPGSYRCAYHRAVTAGNGRCNRSGESQKASFSSNASGGLKMRRSAMANSLVRIGGVEGEWVKRALSALIRPSSQHQRCREAFRPRNSRLSVMCKAEDSGEC